LSRKYRIDILLASVFRALANPLVLSTPNSEWDRVKW